MKYLLYKFARMIDVMDMFDVSQLHKSTQVCCVNVMSNCFWNEFIMHSIRKEFSPKRCDAIQGLTIAIVIVYLFWNIIFALTIAMRSWKVLIEDDIQIKLTIDSSCSNHMINADVRYMYKCESISSFISTAGVPPSCCTKKGSIGPLINVLHVPTADFSLLNMSSIGDEGVTAILTSDEVLYVNNEKVNHVLTKLNV
jgi:hypothetical protein